MAIQYINTGSSANAGNGDSLRSAFIKVNNNFAYLSTASFGGGGNGYTGSAGTNGYTGSAGTNGYTGSAGSQGPIGFTGSAGVGTVTSGNAGRFALYFSSGTVVSQNSILTLSTATVYVGQEFGTASFWLQREVYSNVFGQGFTYSQHHEVSDAMNFSFYRTRGTAGSPTAVQNADELGEIVFFGYNGSAVASGGGFTYHVDGNITAGRIPTKLSIATTNPSFSTPIVGAELSSSSTWKIYRLGHLSTTTSSITVAANLVPDQDSVRSLGSSLYQWRSLYVSSSTIYINRTPLTIDDQGTLLVNGSSVLGTPGYTGSRGNLGYTGSRGDTGYVGSLGDIGFTGSRGLQGYNGSRGDTGYVGSQGDIGYVGSEGSPGQQGNRGYTGSEGAQGNPGQQGLTGAQGVSVVLLGTVTNAVSLPPSANFGEGYITVDTGHVWFWGTASTWNDVGQIVGPQGDQGYTGSQGLQGDAGLTGDTGYTGSTGANGYVGSQGDVGYAGSQGELGYTGSQGDVGYVGSQGDVGYAGSQGELGYVGSQGDVGYTGSTGNRGLQGYDGSQGDVGYAGSQGDVGYTGSRAQEDRITSSTFSVVVSADGSLNLPDSGALPGTAIVQSTANILLNSNGQFWTFGNEGTLTTPGHLLPNADLTYDLGSTSSQWRSIYVGTGTIYIGGVALGVNQDNYVTVDGNPIVTVNTAGNITIQGGSILTPVYVSDVAPDASVSEGNLWYNSLDGRTYVSYSGQWIDTSPAVVPNPETYLGNIAIDGDTLNINGSTLTISSTGTLLVNGEQVISGNNQTIYGATLTASDTDPLTSTGTLWFNTVEGRTYLKYNDQWVDVNPTVVPPPSTYLDEITIDGSTINMNGSILAINTAGVLLVNGSEVTGSGYQLTSGTAVMSIDSSGTITFPSSLQIVDIGTLVGGMFTGTILLQQGSGLLQIASTGTGSVLGWADNAFTPDAVTTLVLNSTGAELTTGNISSGTHAWYFGTDGSTTFPNDTILGTSLDPNVYIETLSTSTTNTWTFTVDGGLTFPDGTTQTTAYTGGGGGGVGYTGSQGDVGYTGSQGDVGYTGSQGDVGYTGSAGPGWDPNTLLEANTATIGVGGLTVNGPVTFNSSFSFLGTATVISSNSGTFFGDTYGVGALYAGVAGFSPLPSTVIQSAANVNAYIQNNFQNINGGNQASTEWVATANNGDDSNHYLDMGIAGGAWDGSQTNSVGTAASANDSWIYAQGSTSTGAGGNLILGTIKNGKSVKILTGSTGSSSVVATFNNRNTNATTTNSGSLQVVGGVGISQNLYAGTLYSNDGYFRGPSGYGTIQLASGGTVYIAELAVNSTGLIKGPGGSTHIALLTGTGGSVRFYNTATISGTTTATSTQTGALTVAGGVGIAGNAYVGGNVVTPNRSAFRVYGSSSSDISTGTTVSATQGVLVDYNQGSYYSTSTGIFTAPVAGLYHCFATLRVGSNNGLNQASIQKNSSSTGSNVIAFWETDTNVGSATHFGMSGYARLAAGDTVRLQVITGKIQFDINDSWGVTFIG